MATISPPVGRGDVLVCQGSDNRVGARWLHDRQDGEGLVPVDLYGWSATFEMESGGETVWSSSCTCTSDGYAWADIPASAFGSDMVGRRGSWRITATDGTRVERLCEGFWEVV
jgi:hypothetical protein